MSQLAQQDQPISHGELRTSIRRKRSRGVNGREGRREGRREGEGYDEVEDEASMRVN
jgi:hypothetical protein